MMNKDGNRIGTTGGNRLVTVAYDYGVKDDTGDGTRFESEKYDYESFPDLHPLVNYRYITPKDLVNPSFFPETTYDGEVLLASYISTKGEYVESHVRVSNKDSKKNKFLQMLTKLDTGDGKANVAKVVLDEKDMEFGVTENDRILFPGTLVLARLNAYHHLTLTNGSTLTYTERPIFDTTSRTLRVRLFNGCCLSVSMDSVAMVYDSFSFFTHYTV